MAGYENAPATRLLATDCAICGRPLVDAPSVESGMGPHCRKVYGVGTDVTPEARERINRIVYAIALDQSCTLAQVRELAALGADRIVAKMAERFALATVTERDGALMVETPYNETLVALMRGFAWDAAAKARRVPLTRARDLAERFRRFPTGWAMGRKGPFAVGAMS